MVGSLSFQGYEGDIGTRQEQIRAKFLELIHHDRTPSQEIHVHSFSERKANGLTIRRFLVSAGDWHPQPIYEATGQLIEGDTLVALHGHGNEPFAGIYDYIHGLARLGHRVVAPILFGTMERETRGLKPDWRDICREWSIEADALGVTLLAARLFDAQVAYRFALRLEDVDRDRIGCIGLSMGGELSLYLAAIEPGIEACVSAGFLSTFESLLLRKRNCQCYSIRDWPRYFDMPDLAACIAPRPLLIQKGHEDPCFDPGDVARAFELVHEVYRRFGSGDRCRYATYPGGHVLNMELAHSWFTRWLA